MCVYLIFFIHSPISEHLVCFYILAVVNNTTMSIGVHISFCVSGTFSLGKIPKSGILDHHMVVLFLILEESPAPTYILPTVHKYSFFSVSSPTLVICHLFDNSHSDRCKVISHCVFYLHFPDDWASLVA